MGSGNKNQGGMDGKAIPLTKIGNATEMGLVGE